MTETSRCELVQNWCITASELINANNVWMNLVCNASGSILNKYLCYSRRTRSCIINITSESVI